MHRNFAPAHVERDADRRASAALTSRAPAAPASSPLAWFEQRFQHDFSRVHIHNDAAAHEAASAIDARAFTRGEDISFAKGEYDPSSQEGAQLLAHELAHVVQRQPYVARQPKQPPVLTRTFQERGGGGTTDFTETVQDAPTQTGDVIEGRVLRSETAPAAGGKPAEEISRGVARVQFDTKKCVVTVPHHFSFQQAAKADPPFCQNPPSTENVTPLSADELQKLGDDYLRYVNEGLNDRFTVKVTGCQNGCADKSMPVKIDAKRGGTTPRVINVVNRSGRGNAGTICAKDMTSGFATHEGGHQVLGLGDEYVESDDALRKSKPKWARDERARSDASSMNDAGRLSLFHERHYRFVQIFLEAALPGCKVQLEAVPKTIPSFRLTAGLGYANFAGEHGAAGSLGFDVAIPLDRLRQTEITLGVRGQHFIQQAGPNRKAFLLGAEFGLEHRASDAGVSPTVGAFGGTGVYYEAAKPAAGLPERVTPYAEAGGTLGVSSGVLGGSAILSAKAELAGGREFSKDPEAAKWFRAGVKLAAEF